ncbi:uncharacterized protein KD926_002910 [Aspergillus affinis]|uniref:uncharacterized protein n=1 Tax=Aspergillus affinis TaxID=1070780 RepID=UPI0022FDC117|nr:uncharacterized protein KD926_002910 [Aspergillus affinis]KAI9035760.1 hypothetical protein KD926_002910 [Aspergillus affinis]
MRRKASWMGLERVHHCAQDAGYISRPDVWRLLLLLPIEEDELAYGCGPQTPWEPCDVSRARDCVLRVTAHLKCPRHGYSYDHWNWDLDNGITVQDYGFSRSGIFRTLLSRKSSDISNVNTESYSFAKRELGTHREASEQASMEMFRWFVLGSEGVPPEKIYQDEWFRGLWNDEAYSDEGTHEVQRDSEPKSPDRVESWLHIVDLT